MKMIGRITFLLFLLFYQASAQSSQFFVQGVMPNAPIKVLYLRYLDYTGTEMLDSAQILKDAFSFTGRINQPTRATLKANRTFIPDEENLNIATIYLEPKTLKVRVVYNQFKDMNVVGSKTQNEYSVLKSQHAPLVSQYILLRDSLVRLTQQNTTGASPETDRTRAERITNQLQKVVGNMRSSSYQFIRNHPDSWVSAFELVLLKDTWPVDSIRYLFNRLTPAIRKGPDGQRIATKIAVSEQARTSVGTVAAVFSKIDLTGKPISLSDFKGRYVLLDFWGSWCVPCRAGNPHLRELYDKYNRKGIEFIGVACEDTPTAWRKAIEKDGIGIWRHILDTELKADKVVGEEKSLGKQYAVDSFPTKILIDQAGIIIGRYRAGDEALLDEKLKTLLN